jgi:predicted Zn-dependent protease
VAGKGDDPVQVAREAEKQAGAPLLERAKTAEINGLRAVRNTVTAEGSNGTMTLDFTWIAHRGTVYRIVGLSPARRFAAHKPLFDQTVSSFRAMTSGDTAQLRDIRLRVVPARAGEQLADIARRTGSAWSANEIAVANALAADARLGAGQAIKVAVSEPYRDRR